MMAVVVFMHVCGGGNLLCESIMFFLCKFRSKNPEKNCHYACHQAMTTPKTYYPQQE